MPIYRHCKNQTKKFQKILTLFFQKLKSSKILNFQKMSKFSIFYQKISKSNKNLNFVDFVIFWKKVWVAMLDSIGSVFSLFGVLGSAPDPQNLKNGKNCHFLAKNHVFGHFWALFGDLDAIFAKNGIKITPNTGHMPKRYPVLPIFRFFGSLKGPNLLKMTKNYHFWSKVRSKVISTQFKQFLK